MVSGGLNTQPIAPISIIIPEHETSIAHSGALVVSGSELHFVSGSLLCKVNLTAV